jgi:hypothetical protein
MGKLHRQEHGGKCSVATAIIPVPGQWTVSRVGAVHVDDIAGLTTEMLVVYEKESAAMVSHWTSDIMYPCTPLIVQETNPKKLCDIIGGMLNAGCAQGAFINARELERPRTCLDGKVASDGVLVYDVSGCAQLNIGAVCNQLVCMNNSLHQVCKFVSLHCYPQKIEFIVSYV